MTMQQVSMPEAKLAREAQFACAALAMVTDIDCWHPPESHVTVELVIVNQMKNAERAQPIATAPIRIIVEDTPHRLHKPR
ncbi:MAG: hypothetical protein ABIO19_08320 [Burkholderiaceae bacterium]